MCNIPTLILALKLAIVSIPMPDPNDPAALMRLNTLLALIEVVEVCEVPPDPLADPNTPVYRCASLDGWCGYNGDL